MHVILSLNSFNITYKSKQRAQARLDRSAPCLGLSYISILNVQYRVKGNHSVIPIEIFV